MHRPLLLASLSAILMLSPAHVARAGDVTCNIVQYPSLQNGYTLSGSITTDGHFGPISATDITAWSYTITQGSSPITTETSTNLGAYLDLVALTASPHQLIVPAAAPAELTGTALANSDDLHSLVFRDDYGLSSAPPFWAYTASTNYLSEPGNLWNSLSSAPPASPWVIAQTAVPEPASLTLALLGGACVAVVEWTRRRRPRPTSPQASPTAHS